jgi:hypothetical protein
MEMRQAAVESRQLSFATSSELSKISIGDLPMTDYAGDLYIDERNTVRPELVTFRTLERADDIERNCRRLPSPDQESNQTPLRDRARRKFRTGCRQPLRGGVMMHMLRDH